jgi:hypothetical protein
MLKGVLGDGPLGVVGPVDDVEEGEGQGEQFPGPLVRAGKQILPSFNLELLSCELSSKLYFSDYSFNFSKFSVTLNFHCYNE